MLNFKHSPNVIDMVYGPNGKGIMAWMKYALRIYSSIEKGMVLWNIVVPSGYRHGKR